jgi:subtilase family serine protease
LRYASVRSVFVVVALFATGLLAAPAAAVTSFSAIPASLTPTTDAAVGAFNSAQMSVEVVLAPNNEAQLSGLLTSTYNPNSRNYQHWLAKGQFNALFAPSSAQSSAVSAYLQANGLRVTPSLSPFIVRATGPSNAVAAAFRTNLRVYRSRTGHAYFSNAAPVQLPTALVAGVRGVLGLSNTVHLQPRLKLPLDRPAWTSSCEAPYPTVAQLFDRVNTGVHFPTGYGAGPGCHGLTPSQDNAIYGAPNVGKRGKGAGVNLALFELSAYQHSDIATWTKTFYGNDFHAPLVDITVDGGPLNPICPAGDTCPPNIESYSGDIEVDADIETQLAISPEARRILVYNAPNDDTGQTGLDEYSKIANDDIADVISSSWGLCENDAGSSLVQAENVIFEQMALQGQSMFASSGDSGAFDCIGIDGTTIVNTDDPSSQPWVTSVGGTSLETFNPGADPKPAYPTGVETVWNVDNLCNPTSEGGQAAFFWCAQTGAGGGGNSQFWGRPLYQFGPGITNAYTAYGNGTTACSLAALGRPCREVPDISADADQYTPYAEYCTAGANTTNSQCGFSATHTPPGWFGIGGTSLSSPLWSAIFADRDSFMGHRSGNANPLLYLLFNINAPGYFHDITGIGQTTNNNGLFPTTPSYDLATGIGSPKMAGIITGFPQH